MDRHLATGDTHGCFGALQTLVGFVGVKPDDTLVTLGDEVNRAPDTKSVVNWLIARHAGGQLVNVETVYHTPNRVYGGGRESFQKLKP